ncbi:MAG: hypothetical protein BWK77_09305 [Verrucomicrobia bacterium A1]|nr:MAG: hypothetical protein BWK77_09305 [Verrucomicrobia bacterium A1]
MSGKPGLAVQEMKRAVLLGADKQRAEMAMAAFYFMDQNDVESERMYADLLRENPKNQVAMLGLARLAARKGDFDIARGYLDALQKLGAPDPLIRMERAVVELLSGNVAEAKAALNKLVEDDPKNLRAWTMLAMIAAEEKDAKALARAMDVLTPASANSPGILLTLAQVAVSGNDLPGARKHLDDMLRIQPNSLQALELLLQMDIWEVQRGLAEEHVDRLINLDPKNALANLVLGSFQYAREEFELAEASYRISLASKKSTRVLNDLAWILQKKGRYEEALKLVREALQMNQNSAAAWDTMGVVSTRLDLLDEAQGALERALSFQPENPHFILHMALLYERKKMRDDALRLADPLLVRPADMSHDAYEELRALIKRLRTAS